MASRKARKKAEPYWSSVLPRATNAALLMCCVLNFLALGWGVKSYQPEEVHHLDTVVTNHYFTITQFVSTVSSPFHGSSSDPRDALRDVVGTEIPVSYHYMEVNGLPMIRYFGRNLSAGDNTSYGRIVAIYPDRVVLDGPVYLKNMKNPDDSPSFLKESTT